MHSGPRTIIITAFTPKSTTAASYNRNITLNQIQKSVALEPCVPPSFSSTANCSKRPITYSRMSLDSSPYPHSFCDEDEEYDSDIEFQTPRKRERLTHLSPEEKLFRRKLKNRIAAQTARDRKKVQMVDLEARVMQLEAENEALKNRNNKLSSFSKQLSDENARLKIEHTLDSTNISVDQPQCHFRPILPSLPISEDVVDSTTAPAAAVDILTSDISSTTTKDCTLASVESAEFINDLQQQGQEVDVMSLGVNQSKSRRPLILFMAVIAMMNCYSNGCGNFSSKNFKEVHTKQMQMYGRTEPMELVAQIRHEIKQIPISYNGKQLLTKKLEELLRSRKFTRLKPD